MTKTYKIVVFEGDGIGPEIMAPTISVLDTLSSGTNEYRFDFEIKPAGANHYSRTGVSLPAESLDAARNADAILLSAMGDPEIRYPDGTEISPQIELRKELDLYAGLRPVRVLPGYPSPLKLSPNQTIDFMLIRESTEGLFWSSGRGEVSDDEARETLLITRNVSEKLFNQAFEIAIERQTKGTGTGQVTCVDKANVFRAFAFFRDIFYAESKKHTGIEANAAYVDATALNMVQQPWLLDVLVTENMFGDILSDLGAGIMGGLGLAPSADIGDTHAVFQPCHGSAPDIAGKGIANPIAMILSAKMMLEWLGSKHDDMNLTAAAARLQQTVDKIIQDGSCLTPDLGGDARTMDVYKAIIQTLSKM